MWYYTIRSCLYVMYICFYRRIYYINSKNIPSKGSSLIFASNHSNGLLDPILVSTTQPRPVYFWVAAGEIPSNFFGEMMSTLHSIPIYRAKEGRDQMHKNEETFRITKEYLYTGWDSMWIAPEGRCHVQKRLEPVKKGTARLAFDMMEEKNWELDLQIMPTGVNYTNHLQFRSEVYINLGIPLKVIDYKQQYLEAKEVAIAQLTKDIEIGIRERMVYIEEQDVELMERLLPLLRNNYKRPLWPLYSSNPHLCKAEQQLACLVGALGEVERATLEGQLYEYEALLLQARTNDFSVAHQNKRSFFGVLLGFPFWLLGTLSGWLPHRIASALRNKFVPFPAFSTSFAFIAAFFAWILWSIIIMSVGAFFMGWAVLSWPFIMVMLQAFGYHYADYTREWWQLVQFNRSQQTVKKRLRHSREDLPFVGIVLDEF